MKVRTFTLRFDPARGAFDDEALHLFMAGVDVISVQQDFFHHESAPWVFLMLTYRPSSSEGRVASVRGPAGRRDSRSDPEIEALDPAQRKVFDAIRKWRSARSKAEGVPVYIVINNKQALAVVREVPVTKARLSELTGLGDVRIDAYGDELLALLAAASTAAA